MPGTLRRALARLLALAVLALVAGACEARVELDVRVDEAGAGSVELALGLDAAALERRPEAFAELALSGLEEAGWEVRPLEEDDDGWTWLRVRHRFGAPEEVGPLVEQVAGPDGPLRDVRLERDDRFAETRYRFAGTVDLTGGAAGVTRDPELAEALGAEPVELLAERLGAPVDELVSVQVAVHLPGAVESNAPLPRTGAAVWQPSIAEGEVVELAATSSLARTERWVWLGVAVLAGVALVAYGIFLVVRWQRGRRAAPAPTA